MSVGVTDLELKTYYAEILQKLRLTHSMQETEKILDMFKQSGEEFLDENPDATFESFKNHFGDYDEITYNIINEEDSDKIAQKMQKSRFIKRIAVAILVMMIIGFVIEASLMVKSYFDAQNAMVHHEVILIDK